MIKLKSPRTPHLSGSGLAGCENDVDRVKWTSVLGQNIVLEEKVDGSEVSFHFDEDANLILRERANILDMEMHGGVEKVYDELKVWLGIHQDELFDRLQDRFMVYGMWCLAAHAIFYDRLPSYLLEFDVQDKLTGDFLSTARRREFLKGAPTMPIHVLFEGEATDAVHPKRLMGQSYYCSSHVPAQAKLDGSGRMEGVYGKIEDAARVTGRFKWVREDFIQAIIDGNEHWKDRDLIRNGLCEKPDLQR
ncbi:RNA ligase family protein [Rhizobium sp. MHM7A]|uniref:RNA ligase family protein n=1 Tax=Rhizobium sp. MHM7A TaxID=2583233 RepID=UPI001106FAA8|nr:RNA ligase family protein [Rhizobium sp. MHM7A]TLX16736.1 hypothetical protein FFR93_05175 [Rhizobium sp. MHM7A]